MDQKTARDSYSVDMLEKSIAGEIALSSKPSAALRKWREIFGLSQKELAVSMKVSPSVVSDYESGRRSPGVKFVRRFTETLIRLDSANSKGITKRLSPQKKTKAVLSLREFLSPVSASSLVRSVNGKVVSGKQKAGEKIWGYTVIDSIHAILELSERDFPQIYGMNPQRALVFTKVHMGRSPMIAIKVTKPKPAMVVLHGLPSSEVDKLAVKIAEMEDIMLVVSAAESEEELIAGLEKIEGY